MPATREKAESTARAEVTAGTPPGRPGKPAETPRPRRPGLALAVIAAAQLMVMLDGTIVNVALPHIQTALHFGPVAYVQIVFAVYEVACVTQPRLFHRCYEPRI